MKTVIQLDTGELERAQRELGEFGKKASAVLKAAVSSTARKARTKLIKGARSTYIIKSDELKRSAEYVKPTTRNLTAKLIFRGDIPPLLKYKVSPNAPPENGKRPRNTKAKVKRKNPMRPLIKNGNKAFIQKIANKVGSGNVVSTHIGVFQRKTKRRLPIKQLYSISIPHMFGEGGDVMEAALPEISQMYGEEVTKQLKKTMERMSRK